MGNHPRQGQAAAAAALAITALALLLRVVWPTHVDWDGDFALHTLRATELARGERLDVLVGFKTSAGGAHLPGLFHHLLALPALFGAGPVGLTCFVAASNVVAVLLLVTAGRRAFGDLPALVAGLLLAVAPAAVLRARAIRNESLLVPLVVLLLLALARSRREPASPAAGLGVAAAVAMGQLHLSALFFLVPTTLPLGAALRRAGLRRSAPGLVLALVLGAPFLVHEVGGGFPEARAVAAGMKGKDLAGREKTVHVRPTPRELTARAGDLLGTEGFAGYVGQRAWREGAERTPAPLRLALPLSNVAAQAVVLLGLLLSLGGLVPTARAAHRTSALLTLATFAVYFAVGVRARQAYLFLLLPCFCLAAGAAVSWAGATARRLGASWRVRAARTALCSLVLLTAASFVAITLSTLAWLVRAGGAPEARYGATYAAKRSALDWLVEHGYALGSYPSFTYPMTLELAWRAAPPAQQARFTPMRTAVPFWEQPLVLPVPRGPLRTASILEGSPPHDVAPAARFGPVTIVVDARPPR